MCSSLKLERKDKLVGHPNTYKVMDQIPVLKNDGSEEKVQWLGHIREESGTPKLQYEKVFLPVREYVEKDIEFKVPQGKKVSGYIIHSKFCPKKKGLFIVTRKATQQELAKCKTNRHPKLI